MCSYRLAKLSERQLLTQIEIFKLIILNYPWEHWVLSEVIKRPMSNEIQVQQIITVAQHSSLPAVLIIIHLIE